MKMIQLTLSVVCSFVRYSYIFWDHGEETTRKALYSLHQPKKSSTGEIRGNYLNYKFVCTDEINCIGSEG